MQTMDETSAKHGIPRLYVAECRVQYSVAGKDYSLWVQVAQDYEWAQLRDQVHTCPYSTFDVHYNLGQPSEAHAFFEK
jgi:hypothetical protein